MKPGPVRLMLDDIASGVGVVHDCRVVEVRDTLVEVDVHGRRVTFTLGEAVARQIRAASADVWDANARARAARKP